MESRLFTKYRNEIVPALKKEFNFTSVMQVPKILKIVINSGVGDATHNKQAAPDMQHQLSLITGQKPVIVKAKIAVSSFKLRIGMSVGVKTTLRNKKMYDFLDKLCNIVLMQVRDFRGLKKSSFDNQGNYTFGVAEQIIFPELNYDYDLITKTRGFDITIVTNTTDKKLAYQLLSKLGLPFKKSNQN